MTLERSKPPATKISQPATKDPLESRVRLELESDGLSFDDLFNAPKVLNLAHKLETLQTQQQQQTTPLDKNLQAVRQKQLENLTLEYNRAKTQVMPRFLKNVFTYQAIIFTILGAILSFDIIPNYDLPNVARALGFWMIWLFSIPALRARKGMGRDEKQALNVAFLVLPLVNVGMPVFWKSFGGIWSVDLMVLGACYAWFVGRGDGSHGGGRKPFKIKGWLKYLDWGSWR